MNKIFYCNEVMDRLLGLFDQRETYIQRLIALGFDDFVPRIKHFESFAKSSEELSLSREIRKESDKRSLWKGSMRSAGWFFDQEPRPPYERDRLEQLVVERGVKSVMYLDPCYQRIEQWAGLNYQNWRYLSIELRDRQLRRRTEMVEAGVVAKAEVADDSTCIRDFVATRMLRLLDDPKFVRIKKNDKRYVVLAKRLNEFMELRLMADCYRASFSVFPSGFCGPDKELDSAPNSVELGLVIHRRSDKKDRMSAEFVIEFTNLVPLRKYGAYREAAHLAVAIGGPISLYNMVKDEVECACIESSLV